MATQGTDIQAATDIENAKAKLQQVADTKEARRDPRANENSMLPDRVRQERYIPEGKVPPKKKTFGQKLREALFPENPDNIPEHILFDIVVPSIKKVVYEGLNTALCMALGQDPKTNRIINANPHTSRASEYQRRTYVYNAGGGNGGYSNRNPIADCEWDEQTAKDYFNDMLETVEKYDEMSVSDVYAICCLKDRIRTTDRNWGYTKALFTRAEVYPVDRMGERWIIDLPEPRPLR